jgi:hypothetical protein
MAEDLKKGIHSLLMPEFTSLIQPLIQRLEGLELWRHGLAGLQLEGLEERMGDKLELAIVAAGHDTARRCEELETRGREAKMGHEEALGELRDEQSAKVAEIGSRFAALEEALARNVSMQQEQMESAIEVLQKDFGAQVASGAQRASSALEAAAVVLHEKVALAQQDAETRIGELGANVSFRYSSLDASLTELRQAVARAPADCRAFVAELEMTTQRTLTELEAKCTRVDHNLELVQAESIGFNANLSWRVKDLETEAAEWSATSTALESASAGLREEIASARQEAAGTLESASAGLREEIASARQEVETVQGRCAATLRAEMSDLQGVIFSRLTDQEKKLQGLQVEAARTAEDLDREASCLRSSAGELRRELEASQVRASETVRVTCEELREEMGTRFELQLAELETALKRLTAAQWDQRVDALESAISQVRESVAQKLLDLTEIRLTIATLTAELEASTREHAKKRARLFVANSLPPLPGAAAAVALRTPGA